MSIEIRCHAPGQALDEFVRFPAELYRGDEGWTRPLETEARHKFSPDHNPYFAHADAVMLTAWEGSRMVGRCTAQIDHEYLKHHEDQTGHFGCFDTVDDDAVGRTLIEAAAAWCSDRGMKRMTGPYSMSINDELGILVDGFEQPSVLLTPYHRPCQGRIAEAAGLSKAKDLYLWRYNAPMVPPDRSIRAYKAVKAMPEVSIRPIDKSRIEREMMIVRAVFNDAWHDNWSFVPWTDAELAKAVEEFRLILIDSLALIAEIDGKPVGICICIPNLNEAISDLDGRLWPTGIFKLLWRLKVRHPRSFKLPLMGIRRDIQRTRRYVGLSVAMYVEAAFALQKIDVDWLEMGWTLEDNHLINRIIGRVGSVRHKTLRMYEMDI